MFNITSRKLRKADYKQMGYLAGKYFHSVLDSFIVI